MFHYEYEKRAPSREWGAPDRGPRRPLPPRPEEHIPNKTTVPFKVWIIASASCFAVCAALVLATVVITKWGTEDQYTTRELYSAPLEPIYSNLHRETTEETKDDFEKDLPVIQKLPLFKNIVTRDKNKSLLHKPQMHPLHEVMYHEVRKIEKKDQPKDPENEDMDNKNPENDLNTRITVENIDAIPDFKPIDVNNIVKLPDNFVKYKEADYQEYNEDVNLYDDYIQSNSLTNYLMEKVKELHDWVTKDPDFEAVKNSTTRDINTDFGKVLNALNSSLVEGNVSILMTTLQNLYFDEVSNKSVLTNTTDLVSFGILSLDVMLLHNIQVMAWESQEAARNKMMRDPDVFTFNALFLDPGKMETVQNEIQHKDFGGPYKRINAKQDEDDFGRSLLRNILDVGISTARAAIHLGRAYKNTRTLLNQISNKEVQNLSKDLDSNTQALNHLQTSYSRNSVANSDEFTELDCIWILYCRNLVATSKLNPPYGTMARINGVALRMLAGELSADRAIDTILYEAFTGWNELNCNDMFPRCSKVDAASIVMDRIIQPKRQGNE